MYGTDNTTGQYLSGLDHLRQCVADIITTPLNSRVMTREYGCGLFDLVDHPVTGEFNVRVVESVHLALTRWEPRLQVGKVTVTGSPDGVLDITLTGRIASTDIPFRQNLELTRDQLL